MRIRGNVALGEGLDKNKTHKVGVYGTLKKGHGNHDRYLKAYHGQGISWCKGIMLHLHGFPMVVEQNPDFPLKMNSEIKCDIYEVTYNTMCQLDSLEGHPDFYERKLIQSNAHGPFWVYYGNPERYLRGKQRVIYEGVWNGPNTEWVEVDFLDGKQKPHFTAFPSSSSIKNAVNNALVVVPEVITSKEDEHAERIIEIEPVKIVVPESEEWTDTYPTVEVI